MCHDFSLIAAIPVLIVFTSNLCVQASCPIPPLQLSVVIPPVSPRREFRPLLFLSFQSSPLQGISFLSVAGPFLAFLACLLALLGFQGVPVIQGRRWGELTSFVQFLMKSASVIDEPREDEEPQRKKIETKKESGVQGGFIRVNFEPKIENVG